MSDGAKNEGLESEGKMEDASPAWISPRPAETREQFEELLGALLKSREAQDFLRTALDGDLGHDGRRLAERFLRDFPQLRPQRRLEA